MAAVRQMELCFVTRIVSSCLSIFWGVGVGVLVVVIFLECQKIENLHFVMKNLANTRDKYEFLIDDNCQYASAVSNIVL